jgi:hypothetical protein
MKKYIVIIMVTLSGVFFSSFITIKTPVVYPGSVLSELRSLDKKKGSRKKAEALHRKALRNHKKKRYREAEKLWVDAAKSDPSWWKPYFNIACARTLSGRPADVPGFLRIALTLDRSSKVKRFIMTDGDLKKFRNTGAYIRLSEKINSRYYLKPLFMKSLGIYPIGWSREGHFAFVSGGYSDEIPGQWYEICIWNARTGNSIFKERWDGEEDIGIEGYWKKRYRGISRLLNKYRIIQMTGFTLIRNRLVVQNRKYSVLMNYSLKKEVVNKSFDPKTVTVIEMKSVKMTLKSGSSTRKLDINDIKGYLKDHGQLKEIKYDSALVSPFGNCAAVRFGLKGVYYEDCGCEACECPVDLNKVRVFKSGLNYIMLP